MSADQDKLEKLADDLSVSPQELVRQVSRGKLLPDWLSRKKLSRAIPEEHQVLCIGGANIDYKLKLLSDLQRDTSNPVKTSFGLGGVARNVADNLANLGLRVSLMTLLGHDREADEISRSCQGKIDLSATEKIADQTTGTYHALLSPEGSLVAGFVDMQLASQMDEAWIDRHLEDITRAKWIVVDCNVSQGGLSRLLDIIRFQQKELFIVTISGPKMKHLPPRLDGVSALLTNRLESTEFFSSEEASESLAQRWLNQGVKQVVITDGTNPIIYAGDKQALTLPVIALAPERVIDVTGAGDAFSSACIYGLIKKFEPEQAIRLGMTLAAKTIESNDSVYQDYQTSDLIEESKR